jgi:hypothetical protein
MIKNIIKKKRRIYRTCWTKGVEWTWNEIFIFKWGYRREEWTYKKDGTKILNITYL